jgi:hypothetical protein
MTEADFRSRIQPTLGAIAIRAIAEVMEVSRAYAKEVQAGKRLPHPRHWVTLCDLGATAQRDSETTRGQNQRGSAQNTGDSVSLQRHPMLIAPRS